MGNYFGTDGIRGTVGEWPLVPEFFLKLGLAIGQVIRRTDRPITIITGRDTRQSGEFLQAALTSGLLSSGINVFDTGVMPTAGIAWLVRRLNFDAGIVISASHNPIEQNGIKIIDERGLKLSSALEDQIETLIESANFSSTMVRLTRPGHAFDGKSFQELYIHGLLEEHPVGFLQGLKLVIDCSNGAASHFAPEVFSRAGAVVITQYASPNGLNINQECGSERARRAPWVMGKVIHQNQANFGLAFDGDADRVVFVDDSGNLIDGDHILGFLANYLNRHDQLLAGAVVTTQMRNSGLKIYLDGIGIHVYETPVGDKYVVEKLFELQSLSGQSQKFGLGGEQAGHIDIINDLFTTGDGIRTALFVMRAFLESGSSTISAFAAGVGKTPQIIASAYVGQGPRFDKSQLVAMEKGLFEENLDLCRVSLRYSGTEPLFRVMMESNGELNVNDLAQIAWSVCQKAQHHSGQPGGSVDILNCTQGGVIEPQPGW